MKSKALVLLVLVFLLTAILCTAASAKDLIRNNTFDNGVGLPWHTCETLPAKCEFDISNGKYNVTIINKGTDRWDVQFRHRKLVLQQGHTYKVKFTVVATKDCYVYPKIGDQGEPYNEYWHYGQWEKIQLRANKPVTISQSFTMNSATAETCEFAFHLGGECATSALPYTVSFDNIYLDDPQFQGYPEEPEEPTNAIRVNEVGYYPLLEKKATLVSSSSKPVAWKLLNSRGSTVATGQTKVLGNMKPSGDNCHLIDFSSYTTAGTGYKLQAGGEESMPFDIGKELYSQMKYDAIKYFYHNRSGIAIKMPYCEQSQWARPAGHPKDVMGNASGTWYKASYKLDLTGGWYDAGDHGKYMVNGGISVWTMMNQYERAKVFGGSTLDAFGDDTMNIPESGNNLPDILDESRWEVEMLLKMQVPSGTYKGMAHHKAHDEKWTPLGLPPDQDEMTRYLQPPSTAATLNLAAIGAQASRLWQEYDSTFANKCLTVAENAWKAALDHPDIFAPFDQAPGGGPYGDDYVDDDFYWAACELFVTTGDSEYLDYIQSSPHYLEMPTKMTGGEAILGVYGCFDWGNTAGLGTISLALGQSSLPEEDLAKARNNIQAAADEFVRISDADGYGSPLKESPMDLTDGSRVDGYPWGSNSFVENEAIVMCYAYEFGKDIKYLNGALQAMDYLMGRNPLLQCYTTGYGANPVENVHHRFWAYQYDPAFPTAPAGCMVGGPNSGLQDPWVKGSGWKPGGFPSQKCYMDNIESWSTNEVTINWNAPFAWLTAYLDEKGPNPGQ